MVCKNQKKDIPPDRLSSLLAAQGILCALALMAHLLQRMLSPALYRQSRRIYLEQFEEEQLLPSPRRRGRYRRLQRRLQPALSAP